MEELQTEVPNAVTQTALVVAKPNYPVPNQTAHLSGLRKATVFLIAIGEQASAQVIKDLSEEEVQLIGKSITTADPVSSEDAFSVLQEFHELALARSYVVKGGPDYASRMLRAAFGNDAARRLLDRVNQAIGAESANFDSLQKAEPQQLANFVHAEHPQTIALILSHLPAPQAAALLAAMPSETRSDLARRMANLEQISPEIIAKIAGVIGDRLKSLGDISRQSYGGVRAVAEMFNHLDASMRNEILNQISEDDAPLVGTIRDLMFVFEDLLTIDASGIRELINVVDRYALTLALKGTSEKLQNHILQNMSAAGAEMFREDMEALGPVKIRDVEAAQQKVIATVRELEAAGLLSITSGAQETYVI